MDETDSMIKVILFEYVQEIYLIRNLFMKYKFAPEEFSFEAEEIEQITGSINDNNAIDVYKEIKAQDDTLNDKFADICNYFPKADLDEYLEIRKRIEFLTENYNTNISEYKKCIEIYNAGFKVSPGSIVAKLSGRKPIEISEKLKEA